MNNDRLEQAINWASKRKMLGDSVEIEYINGAVTLSRFYTNDREFEVPIFIDRLKRDVLNQSCRGGGLDEVRFTSKLQMLNAGLQSARRVVLPKDADILYSNTIVFGDIEEIVLNSRVMLESEALVHLMSFRNIKNSHLISMITHESIDYVKKIKELDLSDCDVKHDGIVGSKINRLIVSERTKFETEAISGCEIGELVIKGCASKEIAQDMLSLDMVSLDMMMSSDMITNDTDYVKRLVLAFTKRNGINPNFIYTVKAYYDGSDTPVTENRRFAI